MSSYSFSHIKKNNKNLTRQGQIIKSRPDLAAAQHRSFAYDKYQAEAWKKYFLEHNILIDPDSASGRRFTNTGEVYLTEAIDGSDTMTTAVDKISLTVESLIATLPGHQNSYLRVYITDNIEFKTGSKVSDDIFKFQLIINYRNGQKSDYDYNLVEYTDYIGTSNTIYPRESFIAVPIEWNHKFNVYSMVICSNSHDHDHFIL
nr:hypothetical protein 3 [Kirkovirus sp.]